MRFVMKWFEVGIYVQKEWHFALRDVKKNKSRHFAKSKTICVTFLYSKNPDTLHHAIFIEFLKFAEGKGAFIFAKTMQCALHFCKQKTMYFVLHFYIQNPDTLRYIFIAKKQCTLCYVFIYKCYRIVLIPINASTIKAIISKINLSSLLIIGSIHTINIWFSIHTG